MSQKLFGLCAVCALFFAFAAVDTADAQGMVEPAAGPCVTQCQPACCNPCCAPVTYRVGLFGFVRPVYYAPAYYPAYYPYRFVRAPFVPYRAYPPAYCW